MSHQTSPQKKGSSVTQVKKSLTSAHKPSIKTVNATHNIKVNKSNTSKISSKTNASFMKQNTNVQNKNLKTPTTQTASNTSKMSASQPVKAKETKKFDIKNVPPEGLAKKSQPSTNNNLPRVAGNKNSSTTNTPPKSTQNVTKNAPDKTTNSPVNLVVKINNHKNSNVTTIPPKSTQTGTKNSSETKTPNNPINQGKTSNESSKNSPGVNVVSTNNNPQKSKNTDTQQKIDKLRELYRAKPSTSSVKSSTQKIDSSFEKTTAQLACIIKNFQTQIQNVTPNKAIMEEVPSSMIQPKQKEFFKNVAPAANQPKAQNSSNQSKKVSNTNISRNSSKSSVSSNQSVRYNTNKATHSRERLTYYSARNFSKSSLSSNTSVRRMGSVTNNVTSSRSRISYRSSLTTFDPLKQLKDEVQRAIREHKTFTVRGGYIPIRRALVDRGWVEKYHTSYKDVLGDNLKRYQNYTIAELLQLTRNADLTNICKNLIKSKLLATHQVDFYWATNDEAFKENPDKIKLTMINKLKRELFSYTTKQGLCEASKISHWYQKRNVSKLNHPRSYSLSKNGDVKGFIDDFNLTAAMSLLKWIVKVNITKECKLLSPSGKIPLEAFDFAVNECCKFIKRCKHEDIDQNIQNAKEHEWVQFLEYFYKLIHYNNHFKKEKNANEDTLVRKSNYVLNNIKSFYPFVDMDGMMNIWILKPIASSRGRGIHMCRTLQYVLKTVKENSNTRYIVQKYIERPLLIYNTKFDIRQWFLISNCSPLTIWMYK